MDAGLSQAEPASWHWRPALNKIRSETKVPSIRVIRFRIAGVTAAGFPWENCARDAISRDKKRGPDVDFCGGDREGGGGKAETTKRGPRALSFEAMGRRFRRGIRLDARLPRSSPEQCGRNGALGQMNREPSRLISWTQREPVHLRVIANCFGVSVTADLAAFSVSRPPITFEPFIASESKSPTDLDP